MDGLMFPKACSDLKKALPDPKDVLPKACSDLSMAWSVLKVWLQKVLSGSKDGLQSASYLKMKKSFCLQFPKNGSRSDVRLCCVTILSCSDWF